MDHPLIGGTRMMCFCLEMFEIRKQCPRNDCLYVIHTKVECKRGETFTQIMAMQPFSK